MNFDCRQTFSSHEGTEQVGIRNVQTKSRLKVFLKSFGKLSVQDDETSR